MRRSSPRAQDAGPGRAPLLIGRSPAMQRLRRALARLAPLHHAVLLRGETGTGKELAARTLHVSGMRADAPFVAVNCAAIAASLAESELFGHARGAFTGAHRDHPGAFERASGGTLFLDEVGELSLALQAKLLRAIELMCVTPVGGRQERPVRARVVAATHRDLEQMVARGEFREDLYHRLGVLVVRLPALRERPGDIRELLPFFVATARRDLGRTLSLCPSAVDAALEHPWPGNVRALKNAVLRAGALCDGTISAADLVPAADAGRVDLTGVVIPRGDYATMHKALLRQAVHECGSIRKAAAALGVPRSTLGTWLKR